MMIVASNSITVSNVNDGTVVHIAYANSADGTNGFYVGGGQNLLQGTGTASGDVANGGGTLVKGAFNGYDAVKTNTAWNERYINLKSALSRTNAKAGDWYTISVYVKADKQIDTGSLGVYRALGNGDANTNDGALGGIQMSDKPITTQWQQYSWSFRINGISLQRQNTRVEYGNATGDNWVYWAGWMLEEGPVSHPWSPAPSEAHPTYMGTYNDYTQADSLDPTEYSWSQIKGADGKSVWSYPYNRGANRLGSYWSDLKPSPTTDNPPKVGDTIVDMIGNMYQITNVVVSGGGGGGTFDYGSLLTSIKGNDGIGIKSTIITYQLSSSGTTTPTGTWLTTVPTLTKGQYLWTRTTLVYTNNTTNDVYSVSYVAQDGNNGTDGVAGKDGVGIKSTTVTYQSGTSGTVQPTGTWVASPPSVAGGNYLWTRTVWSYTDGTSETGYSVAKSGEKGDKGDTGVGIPGAPGADGKTSYVHFAYAGSADGSANFSTTDPTGRAYVGTLTDFVEQDSTNYADYTWSLIKGTDGKDGANGLPGPKGADGRTSYVHFAYASSADGKTNFSTTDPTGRAYVGTLTDFVEPDSTNYVDYTWSLIKGTDGKDGATGAQGPKGADGRTSYIHVAYAKSADGTDSFTTIYPNLNLLTGTSGPFVMGYGIPNTTWDTNKEVSGISLPITPKYGEVLPQVTNFSYKYTPGVTYTQSVYISTDAPLTGTPINFTWFTSEYGHNTGGTDNLVKVSTNVYRATSTYTWPSNKVVPTSSRNADLMNLTQVFDFTKGTFLQFYKPKLETGSTATPWMPSSSEVTASDWPSYIGQYTDFTQTNSTNPTSYTWSLVKGADGKDGENGIPGPKGADGRTSYVHFAYANSADGSTSFSTTDPTGKAYVGTLTDFVEQDSTNPASYTWSLVKGADGKNGTPGAQGPKGDSVTVTSTSIQYAISTSGTSTPTQWSNSILAPQQGKFLWTRTTVTFSDGKSTVSYSIAFSGSDGKTEDISGIISSNTPPASPKDNQFWNDTSSVPNVLKVYRANNGWVVYQFSAENIASRSITTDKLSVNAVKSRNIDMAEVTYQVADSSKNLAKNTSLSDVAGLPNSSGWTLPSGVTLVNNALGGTNGILVPAGTTATLVNDLWDATDAISDYVLGLWVKSAGVATITVDGVTAVEGGTHPIVTSGDGVWNKMEIKYASTSSKSQLKLTVKATSDTYLARVMLARRDTKLDGMWLPAPEDGMLNTSKLNDQVTQNFSLSNGQLKSIISNLNSGYSSNFTQNSDGTINQITKGNDLVTAINTSPAGVYIKGSKIQLDGTVSVTQDFYAKGGNFKNLNADNFTSGKIKADYIDVATVVAQGLSTTNATIAKTLTMGNDGLITANLQSQTLTYTDTLPLGKGATSFPYTSVGTYKLDKTGFTISSKSTFEGNRPIVNVGGRAFGLKYYEPKLYMNDATITLSSSNATGQETSQTVDGTAIPTTVLTITPYVISMTGGGQYTRMFTNGISTSGQMSSDTLYVSPTTSKYMITMAKGNITMPGMAGDGSKTKGLRTAHIQWPAWWGQKFDIFREGDMVYGTVMQGAVREIPPNTLSDEVLPVGYRPIWQDSVINPLSYLGRDTGVYVRIDGKLGSVGSANVPWTSRWSFSYISADPFPYGDVYGQT